MMNRVHIGRPIRRKPFNWENLIVAAVLTPWAVFLIWMWS